MMGGWRRSAGTSGDGAVRAGVRSLAAAALAGVTAAVGFAAAITTTPDAEAAVGDVRVMPLGDSLTGGPGCWRAPLWTRLQDTGYTDVDFVGTLPGGGCDVAVWDGDNEGHGGALAINVAAQGLLRGWLSDTSPDIVMMNFGTNDIWNRRPTADIIAAFGTLLDEMRQNNPRMRVLVAQIAPVAPSGCDTCQPATVELNRAIATWAAGRTTAQSPITVVDHWTGWDPVADTTDGVHQSDSGNRKMAATWYTALTAALGAPTSGPTGAPTPTATTPPASTPPAGTTPPALTPPPMTPPTTTSPAPWSCSAAYAVVSGWQGGYQAEVTVTAGQNAIGGWTVTWPLPSGHTISQAWNATVTTGGTSVAATGLSWNAALAPGASTTFGIIGTRVGAGPVEVPAVACAGRPAGR